MHNYFIAIKIPEKIGGKIFEKVKEKNLLEFIQGKYISLEDYHFTLRFFGNIDEGQVQEIRKKLEGISFNNFDCELSKLGIFDNRFNGVVWVGNDCKKLRDLVDKIWGRVGEERRKFHAHATIIRFKKILDKEKLIKEMNKINLNDLNFNVNKFYLMKSELLPEGARYSVIDSYDLILS